jgi:hypothetical protein
MNQKNTYLSSLGVAAMPTAKTQTESTDALTSFSFNDDDAPKTNVDPLQTGTETREAPRKLRRVASLEVSMPEEAVAILPARPHTVQNWLDWHPHDEDIARAVAEAPTLAAAPPPQKHNAEMIGVISATDSQEHHQAASASSVNRYLVDIGQETTPAPEKTKLKKSNALASFSWNDATKPQVPTVAAPALKASMSQKNAYLSSLGVPATSIAKKTETPNYLASFSWNDDNKPKEGMKNSVAPLKPDLLASPPVAMPLTAVAVESPPSVGSTDWLNWHPHDEDIAQAVAEAPSRPEHQTEMVAVKTTVKTAMESEQERQEASQNIINRYLVTHALEEDMSLETSSAPANKAASDGDMNHYLDDLKPNDSAVPVISKPKKWNALASFSWSDSVQEGAKNANPLGNWLR